MSCDNAVWTATIKRVFIETQLNSTELNSTQLDSIQLNQLNRVQPISAKQVSRVFVYEVTTYKLSQLGHVRSLLGADSCSRCERVDNSTSSWVELRQW